MKTALFAVVGLLALSFVPVSGHAQMPGEKCGGADKVQVGTTKISTDSQNIIACLLTGNTAPRANVSEWKAMTSSNNGGGGSGNGGMTGGCIFSTAPVSDFRGAITGAKISQIIGMWGTGCDKNTVGKAIYSDPYGDACSQVASSGHDCGVVETTQLDSTGWGAANRCICVNK